MLLSVASNKGGVGKTTLAILLGTELATQGYKVTLLDCDLNQHAAAFGEKCDLANFTVVGAVDEANVLKAIRASEEGAEVIIIDLPGGSTTLALKALQRSNFVLVPCQASLPDVRDAMKTIAQIDDAQDLSRVAIERALIWTRLLPGFESRSARHVRESVESRGVPMFESRLRELAAFRELHLTGKAPRQVDPHSSSAQNVTLITDELLKRLEKLAAAA